MSDEERRKWLDSIEAGSIVVLSSGYSRRSYQLASVDKTTPKQIAVGTQRYWRESGDLVGNSNSYRRSEIVPLTDKIQEVLDRNELALQFHNAHHKSVTLPIATVRKLLQVLEDAQQTKETP